VIGASGDSNVRLWGAENGAVQRTFNGPTDYVFGVAVSADGKTVAAGGADGMLFLWNGENGQILQKLQPTSP
jgi:WD40 repeat protein